MASASEWRQKNIDLMTAGSSFYDVVIVCTGTKDQEDFWQGRLEQTKSTVCGKGCNVIAVHEDWDGGAGNGLGTLYAYVKAVEKGKTLGIDVNQLLQEGASVSLYHTAGKGTRLAPLPGSENNNKPGVKLPGLVQCGDVECPITILEAVIRQTGIYAHSRKGRCSVFWGDQVFIPSRTAEYSADRPADILCGLGPMPTKEEWEEKGLDKYGLIVVGKDGSATQVEKISHSTATALFANAEATAGGVGTSLGSFSINASFLKALLDEFSQELAAKKGKLDADPHFWMPLTLPQDAYLDIMKTKGESKEQSISHYERMGRFAKQYNSEQGKPEGYGLLGAVNTGNDCYWWDYGQLKLYRKNTLLCCEKSEEAAALRQFLGISQAKIPGLDIDDCSLVVGGLVGGGRVRNSILVNVVAEQVDVTDAVLVNVTAKKVESSNAILYNVVEEGDDGVKCNEGAVRADVFSPKRGQIVMRSRLDIDGGKAWHEEIEGNPCSFDTLHVENRSETLSGAQSEMDKRRKSSLSKFAHIPEAKRSSLA